MAKVKTNSLWFEIKCPNCGNITPGKESYLNTHHTCPKCRQKVVFERAEPPVKRYISFVTKFFSKMSSKKNTTNAESEEVGQFANAAEELFQEKSMSVRPGETVSFSSGEVFTKMTNGANLVDGLPTYAHAQTNTHDLEIMKRCCEAELETMRLANSAAAPFYFERVAILSRKQKKYKQEIECCEKYIKALDEFYKNVSGHADVRKGPRYKAILKRLPKAKSLYMKSKNEDRSRVLPDTE